MADYTTGPERIERGRRGGNVVLQKYGPDYFARIGKMGGKATKEQRGSTYYTEIGKKGGAVRKQQLADIKANAQAPKE